MAINRAVFMAERAYNKVGSDRPINIVAGYLEDNLDHLGHDGSVTTSSDYSFNAYQTCSTDTTPVTYPNQYHDHELDCVIDEFRSWVSGHPDEASDINLIVLRTDDYDDDETPAGWGAGDVSTVRGASEIDSNSDSNRPQYYSSNFWLHAAIHEAGHDLTLDHGDGLVYQYRYQALHGEERYCKTPQHPAQSRNENNCGVNNSDSGYQPLDYNCYYYSGACSGDKIADQA